MRFGFIKMRFGTLRSGGYRAKILSTIMVLHFTLWAAPCDAQITTVECCFSESDFQGLGECMAGPGISEVPEECLTIGKCIFGFGADNSLMPAICDLSQAVDLPEPRAICTTWNNSDELTIERCIAKQPIGIDLFDWIDQLSDDDGDVDLRDYAIYQAGYQTVPRRVQSEARIVSVDCCYPGASLRAFGNCISGPGITPNISDCEFLSACEIGYSSPVEPGDFLFDLLCDLPPVTLPEPVESYCFSWSETNVVPVQTCGSSGGMGIPRTLETDVDNDGDLDLKDFAAFMVAFSLP